MFTIVSLQKSWHSRYEIVVYFNAVRKDLSELVRYPLAMSAADSDGA
jgi:hypothetical protein